MEKTEVSMHFPGGKTLTWAAGIFSFGLLLVMIASSPNELRYDERYHLALAQNVESQGWIDALADPSNQSAAGPLYPALHLLYGKLSNLEAPAVRWLNFVLLLGTTLLIGLTRPNLSSAAVTSCAAFSIMAVPFLWTPAGLALTEVPALAAFSGFILMMGVSISASYQNAKGWGWMVIFGPALAGVLLGVAILGRQTYLVALPALFGLLLVSPRLWPHVVVCLLSALLVSGWLFIVWAGLVPPSQPDMNSGLKPVHGLMSLAYLAAATAFISPRFLVPSSFRAALVAILAGSLLAWFLSGNQDLPAEPLLTRLLGPTGGRLSGTAVLAGMFAVGLLWLWNLPACVWKRRADSFQMMCSFMLLALAVSPIVISAQFSSRYLVGMLGVLVLVLQPVPSARLAARIVAGSLIGAATLYMKYWA